MGIYVVTSLKRGSGKTTIAQYLSQALSILNKTILLDADLSSANYEWALQQNNHLGFEHINVVENDGNTLDSRIQHLKSLYANIVVDIHGHDSNALRSVLKHANKMIIPTGVTEQDAQLVQEMLALVIAIKQLNTGLQVYIVLNKIPIGTQAEEILEAKRRLQDIPSAKFLNTVIYDLDKWPSYSNNALDDQSSKDAQVILQDFLTEVLN